jgi:hypothetical protein
MSDVAARIAFLEQFKADILSHFNGAGDEGTRSRINRGMSRAREILTATGALKPVTLSPPPAIGGLLVRNADPLNFVLQDYYGMSMAPTVADMIDQGIGVLETPGYDIPPQGKRSDAQGSHSKSGDQKAGYAAPDDVLELPAKVTLLWLIRHVPVSFWLWFVGIVSAAFVAGLKVAALLN